MQQQLKKETKKGQTKRKQKLSFTTATITTNINNSTFSDGGYQTEFYGDCKGKRNNGQNDQQNDHKINNKKERIHRISNKEED